MQTQVNRMEVSASISEATNAGALALIDHKLEELPKMRTQLDTMSQQLTQLVHSSAASKP